MRSTKQALAFAMLIAGTETSRLHAQPEVAPDAASPAPVEEAPIEETPAPVEAPETEAAHAAPAVEEESVAARSVPEASAEWTAEEEPIGIRAEVTQADGPGETPRYGTGSRVGAPLEEIPATVTIVDRERFTERGAADLQDVLALVPGMSPMWTYGGFQASTLRGFPTVTLFDGRRDSRGVLASSAPQMGIFDLDRVEVLRGPASVLYGYGTVGGAVNLVRNAPSRAQRYELDAGFGLPRQWRVHVGATGPIGDDAEVRVDAGHVQREDFRGQESARSQASASARIRTNPRHELGLRVGYALDRYNTDVGIPTIPDPERPGRWRLPPSTNLANRYSSSQDHLDYQRVEVAATSRFEIAREHTLDVQLGAADDRYAYLAAETLTYVPGDETTRATVSREYLYFARRWKTLFGRVELRSSFRTGPVRHQLAAGYELDLLANDSDRSDLAGAVPAPVDFIRPVDMSTQLTFPRTAVDHIRQRGHALYVFDHVHLTDELVVVGGVRFDAVRTKTLREFLDVDTGAEIPDPRTGVERRPNVTENRALTGQLGAVYDLTPWLTAYVGYSSAFAPVFQYASQNGGPEYDPERGHQLEGGLRTRLVSGDHGVSLDVASYGIRKTDVVIPRGVDEFVQAGRVRSRGVDARVEYTYGSVLSFDVGYAFTAAEYDVFVAPDPSTGENTDLGGRTVALAPRHAATGWARLRPHPRVGLALGGRVVGSQFADQENRVALPRYALLDAAVYAGTDRITFTLTVRNALNEHSYFTSAINDWAANPQVTPGPGRELLGTLRLVLP